jgi:hypothetical protein
MRTGEGRRAERFRGSHFVCKPRSRLNVRINARYVLRVHRRDAR